MNKIDFMPRINIQRTKQINEGYIQLIENRLKGVCSKLGKELTDILLQQLSSKKNAKYNESLNIIRYLKNPKIKNKQSPNNLFSSFVRLSELGVSEQTMLKLVELVFSNDLSYYNLDHKIDNLGTIVIKGNKWFHSYSSKRLLKKGFGGTCGELSRFLYHKIIKSSILKEIESETKTKAKISIHYGYSRTHFNLLGSNHVFLILRVGLERFLIDPSFGEISVFKSSGYQVNGKLSRITIEQYINEIGYLDFVEINDKQYEGNYNIEETIPLGFIDNSNVFLCIGIALLNNKEIPIIFSIEKDGRSNIHFRGNKGNLKSGVPNNLTQYEKDKIDSVIRKVEGKITHNGDPKYVGEIIVKQTLNNIKGRFEGLFST